jgi:hypothetical protein
MLMRRTHPEVTRSRQGKGRWGHYAER